jgi:hypothetical protein
LARAPGAWYMARASRSGAGGDASEITHTPGPSVHRPAPVPRTRSGVAGRGSGGATGEEP